MVRRNEELEALRAEVRRRHRAATQKVSRLRRRGVDVGGTDMDVRRDPSKLKGYTKKQLQSYLGGLNRFTSRQTSYVAGDMGTALSGDRWRYYKSLERQYNRIGNREYAKVADTFLPNPAIKLKDRRSILSKSAQGEAANTPYQEINRSSRGITSAQALEKLITQMEGKVTSNYLPERNARSREEFMQMLTKLGNADYIDKAKRLSDDQFDTLWNYTSFATEISSDYELMKLKARGEEERAHEKIHKDNTDAINELLQWAEFLPQKKGRGKKG